MIYRGVFADTVDSYHNLDLYDVLKGFVDKGVVNKDKIREIDNLYGVSLDDDGYHFTGLKDIDLEKRGRAMEIKLAVSIASCCPEYKIGITRASRDGGLDILVEQEEETSLIDTKDSEECRSVVTPAFLEQVMSNEDWHIYKVSKKQYSATETESKSEKCDLVGVDHMLMNMSNNTLRCVPREEADGIIYKIEENLKNLSS